MFNLFAHLLSPTLKGIGILDRGNSFGIHTNISRSHSIFQFLGHQFIPKLIHETYHIMTDRAIQNRMVRSIRRNIYSFRSPSYNFIFIFFGRELVRTFIARPISFEKFIATEQRIAPIETNRVCSRMLATDVRYFKVALRSVFILNLPRECK